MSRMLNTLMRDIMEKWTPSRYSIARKPHFVGMVDESEFSKIILELQDLPIKVPGGSIKTSVSGYTNLVVGKCDYFERGINPNYDDYYCYLTVNSGTVKAGDSQRRSGVHFDGLQGTNYPEKLKACHQYVASSCSPTVFYIQPFDASMLDTSKHNWFSGFQRQAKPEFRWQPKPFELVFMTAYCVHESPTMSKQVDRVFFRMEYSLKKFDRVGNSINPLIETGFEYKPRPIPKHLV